MNISSILNSDGTSSQQSRQLPPLGSRPSQSRQRTSAAPPTILPGRSFEVQMRQDTYIPVQHSSATASSYSNYDYNQAPQSGRYILPHDPSQAEPSSSSPSGSSSSSSSNESRRKKPYLYAGGFHIKCDECRKGSAKCDAVDAAEGRCSRCKKYNLECYRQPRPPTRTQLAKIEAAGRPKMFAPLSGPMYTKCGEDERRRRDAYFESKGLPASLLYENTR